MDVATRTAIAQALDASIVHVATREFERLSRGLIDVQTAKKILRALRALKGLQGNEMPVYDAWVSLFYLTWYQPSHINLAYTLARKMPAGKNPLRTGHGRLQVIDFGCGALAMQFGLALAGAAIRKKRGACPKIAIVSTDESDHMRRIGKKMWRRFIREIADEDKYPGLEDLRRVCSAMKIRKEHKRTEARRWLTVLHVAYEENVNAVKDEIDEEVLSWEPDAILVTARQMAAGWVYAPTAHSGYAEESEQTLTVDDLRPLEGTLNATTGFRKGLRHSFGVQIDRLAACKNEKSIAYFLSNPVYWTPMNFESVYHQHIRR